jgi:molybdate transport system permease protein
MCQGTPGVALSRSRWRVHIADSLLPLGMAATLVYVAFIALPLVALIVRTATGGSFWDDLTSPIALQALRLSAITSAISLIIILLMGTPFAYTLARRDSPLLRVMDSLVELPIVLPPVVAGVAMLMAFGRNGVLGPALEAVGITISFTTTAVLFAQVFVAGPFYIRAARIGFQGVDRDLEDISQTLGVSPWQTFWRVTLPLAWRALLGGAALSWARAMSEFGATIMFAGNFPGRTQTLPLAIMSAMESDLGAALALSVLATAAAVLVLFILMLVSRWGGRGRE